MATANTGAYDPNNPQQYQDFPNAGSGLPQSSQLPALSPLTTITEGGSNTPTTGAFNPNNPSPNIDVSPVGSQGVTGQDINQWYQQDLGRSPDTADDPTGSVAWNSWSNMDPTAAQQGIYNSPEAVAYRASQAQAAPSSTSSTPASTASTGTNSYPLSPGLTTALSTAAAGTPTPNVSPANQQLRDFMTSQLSDLSTPITDQSASTNPAISAFNAQSQRDQAANQAQLAEQAYAQGLDPSQQGSFNTASQAAAENYGLQRAQNTGNTIYQANQARQQQLQQMLQTATSAGLTDQAQSIQQELASLDAQLSAQGLQQSSAQANNTLGFNYNQLTAQQNRDAILEALGLSS